MEEPSKEAPQVNAPEVEVVEGETLTLDRPLRQ
jgi:hypothetical protein